MTSKINFLDCNPTKIFYFLIGIFSLFTPLWGYEVQFEGVEEESTKKLLQSVSQLEKLKESPPATLSGLKRRAEADIAILIQALQSQAYYDAKVTFHISDDRSKVCVNVQTGPVYPFSSFNIRYFQNGEEKDDCVLNFSLLLKDLKITLGDPALPEKILTAEELILDKLNLHGYAFASIKKRDVFADQKTHSIFVLMVVEIGPLTYFGDVSFKGLERVHETFFYRKLRWHLGELYDPRKIEKTQEALELSGLFRSVNISHKDEPVNGNLLPVEISVIEGKQRSLGFGLNYTTELGPGVTAEWENRNLFGDGQKLSLHADVWQKLQDTSITYILPDFKRQSQNLIWLLEYHHEQNKAFTESALAFSGTIERKISDHLTVSYGGMYKILRSERSEKNGTFDLVKVPLQMRWNYTDSILDPTKGFALQLKAIPSLQVRSPRFFYSINTATGSIYQTLTKDKRHVFAAKLTLGSIIGASKNEIPPPERFFAGSENTLRGYRYLTVGPLGRHDKVLGGRSLFLYSLEFRNRLGENLGWVLFYDIGNVYKKAYIDFKKGIRQSTGLGLRYYTPIGPLRLDIAFPLNKRHIDHSLEVYFSIGQTF